MKTLHLALGNQLFDPSFLKKSGIHQVFMREDLELCTYFKFHKHKIIFFLGAMRSYANELESAGFSVHYEKLAPQKIVSFQDALKQHIEKNHITHLQVFEIEDKFFEKRIFELCQKIGVTLAILPSPMFLCSRDSFKDYLSKYKKPFMKNFYERQRKDLRILINDKGEPTGGRWSFDEENRLALPSKLLPPDVPLISPSPLVESIQSLVNEHFPNHPGQSEQFWLPVTREEALEWMTDFFENRFANFGPYEDAIPPHSAFVYHSVLTPFLNVGLLTPQQVIEGALIYAKENKINMASVEGFIRQIIGWREFIRGIYQNFSEKQESSNFFSHHKKLSPHWYSGTTGIAPLDHTIQKTQQFAYAHHIERLMVVGSLMLLLEVAPQEAHRWFMEMFVDSSDWVMGPNVYGMALFSDGGIFATKPYFCGSNYYRKMGGYKPDPEWCDGVDGLYWSFIEKNKSFFLKNPRMSMMVKTLEKMDKAKKQKIYKAADILRARLVN